MKKENTAIRLKTIMNMRGLRQVDILNLTVPYCQKYSVKMNKSDISQYCSGKTHYNSNHQERIDQMMLITPIPYPPSIDQYQTR